jgi:hypothetical protein
MMSQATDDSLIPVLLQQLLQPLGDPGAFAGGVGAGTGEVTQFPHGLVRHEPGPQQPMGTQLRQPGGVADVGLAAGQVPGIAGVDQDHIQALGQQVDEGLPVVRRRLDHHQRDPRVDQVLAQVKDRPGGPGPGRRLGGEGPAPSRVGRAHADLGVLLADVQARTAFVEDVHGLLLSLGEG